MVGRRESDWDTPIVPWRRIIASTGWASEERGGGGLSYDTRTKRDSLWNVSICDFIDCVWCKDWHRLSFSKILLCRQELLLIHWAGNDDYASYMTSSRVMPWRPQPQSPSPSLTRFRHLEWKNQVNKQVESKRNDASFENSIPYLSIIKSCFTMKTWFRIPERGKSSLHVNIGMRGSD